MNEMNKISGSYNTIVLKFGKNRIEDLSLS